MIVRAEYVSGCCATSSACLYVQYSMNKYSVIYSIPTNCFCDVWYGAPLLPAPFHLRETLQSAVHRHTTGTTYSSDPGQEGAPSGRRRR